MINRDPHPIPWALLTDSLSLCGAGSPDDPKVQSGILILPPLLTRWGKGMKEKGILSLNVKEEENGDQVPEMREEVAWVAQ